ncbi:hypothetical protein CUMW_101540 [Citrus unshiu]|nr:hypothetical protein CUMW_101540 [Citrus unshiu]
MYVFPDLKVDWLTNVAFAFYNYWGSIFRIAFLRHFRLKLLLHLKNHHSISTSLIDGAHNYCFLQKQDWLLIMVVEAQYGIARTVTPSLDIGGKSIAQPHLILEGQINPY